MAGVPHISKRFALKRFLGLSAEEVAENEKLWKEENIDEDTKLSASAEMRSAGVSANSVAGDLSSLGANTAAPMPGGGEEGAAPGGAPTPPAAGATEPSR
jgi:hypothetical protein